MPGARLRITANQNKATGFAGILFLPSLGLGSAGWSSSFWVLRAHCHTPSTGSGLLSHTPATKCPES